MAVIGQNFPIDPDHIESRTLAPLAAQSAKYATLFIGLSIIAAWSYNLVFFHNVDGDMFSHAFIPLLTINDYLSTSFLVSPIIIASFLIVNAITYLAHRYIAMVTDSAIRKIKQNISNGLGGFVLVILYLFAIISVELVFGRSVWLRRNRLKRYLNYVAALVFVMMPVGWYTLMAEQLHGRYIMAMVSIGLLFLFLYSIRMCRTFNKSPKRRLFYAACVISLAVLFGGGLYGDYMFDAAMLTRQKRIDLQILDSRQIDLLTGKNINPIEVYAVRSLEKGIFVLYKEAAGQHYATFVSWERNMVLRKDIDPPRQEAFVCQWGRKTGAQDWLRSFPGVATKCGFLT